MQQPQLGQGPEAEEAEQGRVTVKKKIRTCPKCGEQMMLEVRESDGTLVTHCTWDHIKLHRTRKQWSPEQAQRLR